MSVEFVTFATHCVTHPLNFAKIHNLNIGLLLVSASLATLGCGNRANCLTTASLDLSVRVFSSRNPQWFSLPTRCQKRKQPTENL